MYDTESDSLAIEIDPKEEILYRIQRQVAGWVSHLIRKKFGGNQSALAKAMDKKQPYVNRILANGGANLTLRTVAELEIAFGEPVLLTPPEYDHRVIYDSGFANALYDKMKRIPQEDVERVNPDLSKLWNAVRMDGLTIISAQSNYWYKDNNSLKREIGNYFGDNVAANLRQSAGSLPM